MTHSLPFALTQLLSDLTGRAIRVADSGTDGSQAEQQVCGAYELLSSGDTVLVVADLSAVANIAGLLLGFPAASILEKARQNPPDPSVSDALHELFNICAGSLSSTQRAVLRAVLRNKNDIQAKVAALGRAAARENLRVLIGGKPEGFLTVLGL